MNKTKFLVVAAYSNELNPLCKMGKKDVVAKKDITFLAAGIGPVAAACGLARFLTPCRPQMIISIGTAGIINKRLGIGDVVLVKKAGVFSGQRDVYAPQPLKAICHNPHKAENTTRADTMQKLMPKRVEKTFQGFNTTSGVKNQIKNLINAESVTVFCPQEISKSEDKRRLLLKEGYDAENLEAYAFAHVAGCFKVPIISLLGLTNSVGPSGHNEWLKNEARVCAKMAMVVNRMTGA
ncbi:MAG: hypothetical protein HQM16_09295 [Deltaproteobacteria bacterium]|nr:hypothetical protein [Deltaproteobacteria bacterium]